MLLGFISEVARMLLGFISEVARILLGFIWEAPQMLLSTDASWFHLGYISDLSGSFRMHVK